MVHRWNLIVILAIGAIALAGCKKEESGTGTVPEGNDANTAAVGTSESSTTQLAQKQDLDTIRNEAQMMSESQLQSEAQKVAADYTNVKAQIETLKGRIARNSVGGMIAGDTPNLENQLQQLNLSATDLKDRYDVYSSVARQKGINIAALEEIQTSQPQSDVQMDINDVNTPDANMPASDANSAQPE